MKIYIAGKWQDRKFIKDIISIIETEGHEITCDWTRHDFSVDGVIGNESVYAEEDLQGIRSCELLLAIAERSFVYKGLLCEIGAALVLYKPVYLLGRAIDSCIFTNHWNIERVFSVEDFITRIKNVKSHPSSNERVDDSSLGRSENYHSSNL